MIQGPEPAINVLKKHHPMEQPILFFAQLWASNLESRYNSYISSNFRNPGNKQELKVNKKGFSRDKIDVTHFISLTTHLRSIYFYFTRSNAFLYPVSVSKGRNTNKDH